MINIELINASAGSGKTYNLTYRVVDLIKKGIDPEALMVTTFTNRAAAELRSRIRTELLKNQQAKQANRINDGFIGTVNSICGQLLKEYALEAGLSPALEVMPEEDSAGIFKISVDRIIDRYGDQIEPVARRMERDGGNNKDWRDDVKKIVDLARSNRISLDQLKKCSDDSWQSLNEVLGDSLKKDLDQALYEEIDLAIININSLLSVTKTTQKAGEDLETYQRKLERGGLTWGDWARLAKLKAAKDGQALIDPVKIMADHVLVHPQFQADLKEMIAATFNCAIEALKDYDAYKQAHGLMDFTDQESRVLEMAIANKAFRQSLSDRIDVLMVDEFQDTSPIQLALFLALNKLAGKSLWVGDPKQAIYGFRGTDSQLMDDVVALMGKSQVLDCSWRSKERLIDFTNAFFTQVFHTMESEKVCLNIPKQRLEKAKGGSLEGWHLLAKNNQEEAAGLANGIRDLLDRIPGIKAGDIAILCRTNAKCTTIAGFLNHLGIRASVGQGLLLETRECGLAMAALRYMTNQDDSLALTEIVQLIVADRSDEDWLAQLMADSEGFKDRWKNDDLLKPLNEGRKAIGYWTPLEALEEAIDRVGLLEKVASWPNADLAMSNLDVLRKSCQEYIDQCALYRNAATIDGFVSYLQNAGTEQAKGFGHETVNILTYHSAKGLEWPWLILTDLDKAVKMDVFGVNIEAAAHFDPADPLANRAIRYWPWPFGWYFGRRNAYPLLDDKITDLPLYQTVEAMAEREAQRLLYVGMTRAKEGLVMAVRKTETKSSVSLKTAWLDVMTDLDGNPVISLDLESGLQNISLGKTQIPMTIYDYSEEGLGLPGLSQVADNYLPQVAGPLKTFPPARLAPSQLRPSVDEKGKWIIIKRFESRITIKGKLEMDRLGNAIHSFLALNLQLLNTEEQLNVAQNTLKNWDMEMMIDAADLVRGGKDWSDFIKKAYPRHKAYREWPMAMRNKDGQLLQGWIDMLLESDDGYVIIDHKTYPGQGAEDRLKKHIPQMKAYQQAVERSTGKAVKDMLLHLPVSGLILSLA